MTIQKLLLKRDVQLYIHITETLIKKTFFIMYINNFDRNDVNNFDKNDVNNF